MLCYFNFMYLLYFFAVPTAFVYFFTGYRDQDAFHVILSYISGFLAGLLLLFVETLFLSLMPLDTTSFIVKYITIFISESIIPFIGGPVLLFYILEAPIKQRISNIRPQLFGIATVFLPAIFLQSYNHSDMWAVLFMPIMLLSVLFLADFFVGRFISAYYSSIDGLDTFFALMPIVIAFLVSDLCKTLWFYCVPAWIFLGVSVSLVGLAFFFRIVKYRK